MGDRVRIYKNTKVDNHTDTSIYKKYTRKNNKIKTKKEHSYLKYIYLFLVGKAANT